MLSPTPTRELLEREAIAWRRWIAAVRASPLGSLVARTQTEALVEPASLTRLWRGAVRETGWRLLLNAARERLLDSARSRDCLRVSLDPGTIAVPLVRAGPFELDWPDLERADDPGLDDPLAIIELLGARERLPTHERARLRAEIGDSIVNLAQARLARELRLALGGRLSEAERAAEPHLSDPEQLVTDGHPWHPMTRTRLGLRRAEVLRYAGEQLATTPVGCVEIEAGLARVAGDYLELARQHFGHLGRATPGFVRVPIHPAQRRRIPALFPDLCERGAIRPVGSARVLGGGPTIPCRSLLSLRTVALAPGRHLKLACDVLTTSTRRHVSPMSVHNGPLLSRLLLDIQARDPLTAPLRLMIEPGAAGLEPERVGAEASQLGAILRAAPGPAEQAWVCAAVGEPWPGAGALTLERAAAGYPGGRRERIAALIDDWIAQLVPPALRLYARYGVALELHLQNTLVRVVDGRAAGFWVRDLGGIRIHTPRLAAAGLPSPPRFAEHSFIVTDELDEVRGKLEHTLFHAHLAHVFAVAGTLGVDERRSWAKVSRCVEANLTTWADEPGLPPGARERLRDDLDQLTRPRVRAKALLRMRLRERSSDYDYTEVANVLARPAK